MQTLYAQAPAPTAPRDGGLRAARMLVVVYFCACALHGLMRLRQGGASPAAFASLLSLWYAEAVVFGAVFGLAALVHGVVRGGGGGRAPRLRDEPRRGGVLRALERDRGR